MENSLTAYGHTIKHWFTLDTPTASGSAHIFFAKLIHSQMDSSERASSDLILDDVLVDMVLSLSVFFIVRILGSRIESFLHGSMLRGIATMVSEGALICRSRAIGINSRSHKANQMDHTVS